MPKTFYVTTPIYYANDVPHLGHAYTTVAADVIARYKRMMGYEVYFLTGTDEHGKKMQEAAEAKGAKSDADVLRFCDEVVPNFQKLWQRLNISNDDFIRTTQERHKTVVRKFWKTVQAKGDIYKDRYEGLYCTACEEFYTEKELENGNCPIHKKPATKLAEESYFFRMSRFGKGKGGELPALLDRQKDLPDNQKFIQPPERFNEIRSFLENELRDLSVSRSTFTWGIPVDGDEKHVTYVWMDALVNYISALGWDPDPAKQGDKFRKFWASEGAEVLHLIGKDIIRFHTVYWPTFLMSAGVPLPKTVYAHGWWTVEGQKMSKSLRNVVDPNRLVDAYGADLTRYYLMRATPFGQDGNFSHDEMANRVLAELSNGVGNLLARVLAVVEKGLPDFRLDTLGNALTGNRLSSDAAAKIRASIGLVDSTSYMQKFTDDPAVIADEWILKSYWAKHEENPAGITYSLDDGSFRQYCELMGGLHFNYACAIVNVLVTRLDRLVQTTEPWKLLKQGDGSDGKAVILLCLKGLKAICIMLSPFMPVKMQEMWEQLGYDGKVADFRATKDSLDLSLAPKIRRGQPLFPSKDAIGEIRDRFLAEAKGAAAGEVAATKAAKPAKEDKKPAKEAAVPGIITIDDFMNVELKVATVIEAVKVEKSDKLLKLQVKIGDEQRQVLAGIAKSYQPEQLVGRQVVVVANLKPAKLMGLESQGMILAAETEDGLVLAGFEKPPRAGSRVK